jgi:hypothetical protein
MIQDVCESTKVDAVFARRLLQLLDETRSSQRSINIYQEEQVPRPGHFASLAMTFDALKGSDR